MWRNLIDSNNIISNNGKKRHSYFLTMNLYTQKKKKKKYSSIAGKDLCSGRQDTWKLLGLVLFSM